MVRTPGRDQSGLRKGTWTPEEDKKLIAYVTRYGCWNWRQLPRFAGLSRCGKSCRLRWMNYLRPNIKRGNYSEEEEEIITRLHESLGNRWSAIAAKLPGRTDNEIKNHWHTSLKKKKQGIKPTQTVSDTNEPKQTENYDSNPNNSHNNCSNTDSAKSVPSSPHSSCSDHLSSIITDNTISSSTTNNIDMDSCNGTSLFEAYEEPRGLNFWTEPFVADNFDMGMNDFVEPNNFDLDAFYYSYPHCYPVFGVDQNVGF
ncbi:uncharacterized protein [Rutidosis leptorrhynchoides]|uniref:uncharacterized protein n=1 Tax=Rutidosis leptorrhynchoides TaxID=125765 RepID=UPI003A990A48